MHTPTVTKVAAQVARSRIPRNRHKEPTGTGSEVSLAS